MRIVIDTNLIVSAFIWGGTPLILIKEARLTKIEIISSTETFDELKRIIMRPKFINSLAKSNRKPEEIISRYQELVKFIHPATIPTHVVRDPKDIKFLECAVGGQADYIITGDNDLLVLKEYQGIRVVTASEFLTIIQKGQ